MLLVRERRMLQMLLLGLLVNGSGHVRLELVVHLLFLGRHSEPRARRRGGGGRGRSRLQVQVGSFVWVVGVGLGRGFIGHRHGRPFSPLVRIGHGSGSDSCSGNSVRIVALVEGNDGREVFNRVYPDIVDLSYKSSPRW